MMSTTLPRSDFGALKGVKTGQGQRQIVLLHGVGMRAESWQGFISRFSGDYELLALDLPGHGYSPFLQYGDIYELSKHIEGALSGAEYVVIGHSLGALIALQLALNSSKGLKAAVCVSPIYQRARAAKLAVQKRAKALNAGDSDPTQTLNRWFGDEASPLRALCHDWLTHNGAGYGKAYQLFADYEDPNIDQLGQIQMPMLFTSGADDVNSTADMSKALAKTVKCGKCAIVDEAKHMMPLTHLDSFEALIRGFLKEIGHV